MPRKHALFFFSLQVEAALRYVCLQVQLPPNCSSFFPPELSRVVSVGCPDRGVPGRGLPVNTSYTPLC